MNHVVNFLCETRQSLICPDAVTISLWHLEFAQRHQLSRIKKVSSNNIYIIEQDCTVCASNGYNCDSNAPHVDEGARHLRIFTV